MRTGRLIYGVKEQVPVSWRKGRTLMSKKLLPLVLIGIVLGGCATGTEEKIQTLVRQLGDPDAAVREKATRRLLWTRGAEVEAELLKVLKPPGDENSVRRLNVCKCLGEMKSGSAVGPLILLLQDEEILVREEAVLALEKINPTESTLTLFALLEKGGDNTIYAALVLWFLDEPAGKDHIQGVVRKKDEDLVENRLSPILMRIDKKMVDPLLELREDEDPGVHSLVLPIISRLAEDFIGKTKSGDAGVRENAAYVLGKIGDEEVVKPLIDLLEKEDEGVAVRLAAVKALGEIGDARAKEPLAKVIEKEKAKKKKNRDLNMAMQAAKGLCRMGDKRGATYCFEAVKEDDNAIRLGASEILDEMAGFIEDDLLKALKKKDEKVKGKDGKLKDKYPKRFRIRWAAAKALGNAEGKEVVSGLIEALGDEKASVRWTAAISLGKLGDEKARKPLEKLLEDESGKEWGKRPYQNGTVRYYAQWALDELEE